VARRSLVAVDEHAVVADYEGDVTVTTICETHQIPLTRLYRILDRHQVQRRRLKAPRLPKKVRERILRDYVAGVDVTEIARRHRVAPSTVSNVALRHGVSRVPNHGRDELVELVARYLIGDDLDHEEREAIRRVGCRTQAAGLRTLDELDPAIVGDVALGIIAELRRRYSS